MMREVSMQFLRKRSWSDEDPLIDLIVVLVAERDCLCQITSDLSLKVDLWSRMFLTAGLLGMKGNNFLTSSIKIVGDFAKLLMVPQLSTVLAVAGPVASGIQELLGNSDGRLELGLHQTFVGKGSSGGNTDIELRPGYVVIINGKESQLAKERLRIIDGRLHYEQSHNETIPLTGFTYMLFRIEEREERDDWAALSTIAEPYNKAVTALSDLESEKAESLLRAAVAAALQSADLTRADRSRVVKAMKDEYDKAKRDLGLGVERREPIQLDKVMQKAVSVDEAMREPEPTFASLFSK
jgi:hypothetical protein